jgi:plasmid stabilization system protein ParE
MVKRKIIWSHRAKIRLYEILKFYIDRNQSNTYSKKLYSKVNKELGLLKKQPDLGIKTEIESVRGLIISDYIVFYEELDDKIIVHNLWDCGQNPDELKIK